MTEGVDVTEQATDTAAEDEVAEGAWVPVGTVAEVRRARKTLVRVGRHNVALFWHNDQAYAFQNTCVHKKRHLVKGTMLGDRVICPGHQWAFDIETGYEKTQDACQPTFPTRVVDDVVEVQNQSQVLVEDTSWTPESLNR